MPAQKLDDAEDHLQRFLPRGAGHCAARAGRCIARFPQNTSGMAQGLQVIAECYQPILLIIAELAAGSPQDVANLCSIAPCFVQGDLECMGNFLWRELYMQRWPAFHECLRQHGAREWRECYRETLAGRCECTLEVFDREKKRGFAMSAMPARVTYEAKRDIYIAGYLSASKVLPESIPSEEEYRLRFCPTSVRSRLLPKGVLEGTASLDRVLAGLEQLKPPETREEYPYKVLADCRDLVPGQGVELQWKMQRGSPFGWWYGNLDALRCDEDTGLFTARISFRHFPANSRWYQLDVRFGDSKMHPCDFGGFTGGIRAASEDDQKHWMRFFPKEPTPH